MRTEIRLAGNGGQGLILAGIVLAEAAGLYDGMQVVQSQVYGPESRGGASRADVIVADTEIDYPKAIAPDVLLVMSQEAYAKFGKNVRAGGLVLYDVDLVDVGQSTARAIGLPFTRTARDQIGKVITATMVGLGAVAELSGIVTREALETAAAARAPGGTAQLNLTAIRRGYALAAEAQEVYP